MDPTDREGPAPGLRAGTVARAHGLDGSFHVAGVVESVLGLIAVGSEVEIAQRRLEVTRVAGHPGRPILRLAGLESREAAEALRGRDIHLPRAAVPALQDDEWWAEDLEGCAVVDGERPVGTVRALLELPSCEVLEVVRESADDDGRSRPALLVPLISDAVRTVDIDARVIDVDLGFLGEEA